MLRAATTAPAMTPRLLSIIVPVSAAVGVSAHSTRLVKNNRQRTRVLVKAYPPMLFQRYRHLRVNTLVGPWSVHGRSGRACSRAAASKSIRKQSPVRPNSGGERRRVLVSLTVSAKREESVGQEQALIRLTDPHTDHPRIGLSCR